MADGSMCEPEPSRSGDDESPFPKERAAGRLSLARTLPLALLITTGLVLWFGFDLGHYLSFEALRENREALQGLVAAQPWLSAIGFVVLYALVIAFSVPAGAVLTVVGGFLFGTFLATAYVVVGATLGAIAVFLAARTALHDYLRAKVGRALVRMEAGFRENALSYMLVLRLIPLFPFWLVNLVPAFLGVPLGTYALGTLLGIIPGTFVYASLGNGLGALFAAGQAPDLDLILDAEVLTPILGLAVLALLPVAYKKWRLRRR